MRDHVGPDSALHRFCFIWEDVTLFIGPLSFIMSWYFDIVAATFKITQKAVSDLVLQSSVAMSMSVARVTISGGRKKSEILTDIHLYACYGRKFDGICKQHGSQWDAVLHGGSHCDPCCLIMVIEKISKIQKNPEISGNIRRNGRTASPIGVLIIRGRLIRTWGCYMDLRTVIRTWGCYMDLRTWWK